MGRRVKEILSFNEESLKELQRISRSHSEPKRRVDRARIVLASLQNDNQTEVAKKTGIRLNTIGKWRSRFILYGIAGLNDAARSGKPKTIGKDLRKNILKLLETPPPKKVRQHWTA